MKLRWACTTTHRTTAPPIYSSCFLSFVHLQNYGPVTPWMVPTQNRSPRTVCSRIYGPPGPNIAAIIGPPLPWRSERLLRLRSEPRRMKLTMRYFFMYVWFEAMNSSDSALQLLTQYSPRQVVESRVESLLWQENGRMHWWRRHITSAVFDRELCGIYRCRLLS